MKKSKRVLVIFLCMCMLATALVACGNNQTVENVSGTYKGQYRKLVGDPDDSKNTSDSFSIILNSDGTGIFKRDGTDYTISEWNISGTSFTMEEKIEYKTSDYTSIQDYEESLAKVAFGPQVIRYTGVLDDNILEIYDGNPDNATTNQYILSK